MKRRTHLTETFFNFTNHIIDSSEQINGLIRSSKQFSFTHTCHTENTHTHKKNKNGTI